MLIESQMDKVCIHYVYIYIYIYRAQHVGRERERVFIGKIYIISMCIYIYIYRLQPDNMVRVRSITSIYIYI